MLGQILPLLQGFRADFLQSLGRWLLIRQFSPGQQWGLVGEELVELNADALGEAPLLQRPGTQRRAGGGGGSPWLVEPLWGSPRAVGLVRVLLIARSWGSWLPKCGRALPPSPARGSAVPREPQCPGALLWQLPLGQPRAGALAFSEAL